ncbi:hypothetical protein BSNK01_08920 [Bacillaceae bacterium]
MEWVSFSFFAMLLGFRHGMDSDHIAAIADMVGAEKQRDRQLKLGIMYAVGHGAIVLAIGFLAIFAGARLPEGFLRAMEFGVGMSLLLLGMFILYSLVRRRDEFAYHSRWQLLSLALCRLLRRKAPAEGRLLPFGVISAFVIGIIHGIGAETPTQVLVISSSAGLSNSLLAAAQLFLFVAGLLAATILVTYFASWGFMKANVKRKLSVVLGTLTGLYSVALGLSILSGI